MAIHAMKPVDAAWYRIDSDANPAIVTGVAQRQAAAEQVAAQHGANA